MQRRSRVIPAYVLGTLCATCAAFAPSAGAQTWPAKPIRFVVPFPPGGGTDIIARELGQKIAETAKWTFLVENKPGSGGNLGVDNVAKSPADGYSIVLGQTSNLAISPGLYKDLPYDPVKDLAPVALVASSPLVMVVTAGAPLRSLADLIAAAKAKPDAVTFATSGNGTVSHLAMELLKSEADVKLTHVPYKGAAQGLTDVLAGRVNVYVSSVPTLLAQVKGGKMRALAVTSLKRVGDLPDTPTVAESGFKGFDAVTWFGVLGPAKLPANITTRLNAEVNKALAAPDFKAKMADQGAEVGGGTADQFARFIRDETAKWTRVVKESGATID